MFVHHVYFWLKDPGNKEDLEKLVEGIKTLGTIKDIQLFHIGKPADTNREVIDVSYAASLLLCFENRKHQDNYQVDPIHLKFVERCSDLWEKVIVYDSIDL